MHLRRFTDTGIDRFRNYITSLKAEPKLPPPFELLEDPTASTLVDDAIDVEQRTFENRLAAAEYLHSILSNLEHPELERDTGLWAWLALFYFDQLCPEGKTGNRKVGVVATYIPEVAAGRRFYRHLLLGPWAMLNLHSEQPETLRGLLSSPVNVATSETYRLFIENPSLIACRGIVATATILYFDSDKQKMKRGAGSKDPGGCRRLVEFLQQLDCTYDLPQLKVSQLITMLPAEFKRFIPKQKHLFKTHDSDRSLSAASPT